MKKSLFLATVVLLALSQMSFAQAENHFLGKWNITGDAPHASYVYWLEVKEKDGKLEVWFLNRGGSAFKPEQPAIEGGKLTFTVKEKQPQPFEARIEGDRLAGTFRTEKETVNFHGVRPPKWAEFNANGKHTFEQSIELFDGKSMNGWGFQNKKNPSGWKVEGGILENEPNADNLVSLQKFTNFKLQMEYKLEPKSNSGIYLRGRYELQVLDDAGKPAESHGHMSIYGRTAPLVNSSKPAGEWQTMEAVLVGNRVTVHLNGKKVHDNAAIEGITGGALDSSELDAGPLMIQGDHGRIWIKKITLTPIR
jgi:hypothetical protein